MVNVNYIDFLLKQGFMAFQYIFKRYELKYLLNKDQKNRILERIAPYMSLDKYGRSVIRNVYFDTYNYRLIRRSIDKPEYKEKLRIRAYERASADSAIFVELKKKYQSVVYKRRISMPQKDALSWICDKIPIPRSTQISREIEYFRDFYGTLRPTAFLSYEREAYYSCNDSDFRITFDENILSRRCELTLDSEAFGLPVLDNDLTLMEIKCSSGIPMWMTSILSDEKVYKTSFSKYGTAYCKYIFPNFTCKEIPEHVQRFI